MKTLIYIAIMAGVTYLIRMIPFTVFQKKIRSRFVLSFLHYVPYAVLSAMTIPAIFYSTGSMVTAAAGTVVAIVLAYFEKPLIVVALAASAAALLAKAPEFDLLITAESKGIPLAHEMAAQAGMNKYILARKAPKLYMKDPVAVEVKSITTAARQTLYLDKLDMDAMKDKRILIVDDVISTGESVAALETLVRKAGGNIVGKMAILAEGDAKDREDILYLEYLPLFDKDGNAL